jgi:hypothetical protein
MILYSVPVQDVEQLNVAADGQSLNIEIQTKGEIKKMVR